MQQELAEAVPIRRAYFLVPKQNSKMGRLANDQKEGRSSVQKTHT